MTSKRRGDAPVEETPFPRGIDAQVRRRFHYGIFRSRDSGDIAPAEILGTAPLPITHLRTGGASVSEYSGASRGERPHIRAASFLFGIASTLSSKLARFARLFRARSFH